MATPEQSREWAARGFLRWDAMLSAAEVDGLRAVYDEILAGRHALSAKHRYDLGAGAPRQRDGVENITQVMWPSDIVPSLAAHPMRERARAFVAALHGDPAEAWSFDFDMLIDKAPHTATPTPAHQDQSYWIELPDKRAVSIWVALDASTLDNGCMWYAPGTHLAPLRAHRRAGDDANAALQCDATEGEMEPMPLPPGSAGLHAGRTVHYSRGNTTGGHRRAYILNFRPAAMVAFERAHNFDHGRAGHKSHEVRSTT